MSAFESVLEMDAPYGQRLCGLLHVNFPLLECGGLEDICDCRKC